jgi:uncharacterized damage-inducible protein DinB
MTENQQDAYIGDRPRTVIALLERIAQERNPLEQAAIDMDDDHFADDSHGWSVKDHLAHVAAWEQRLLGEIRGDRAAERFGLSEDANAGTDAINAMIYARHRDDLPDAVRAAFTASGEALRTAFASMDDAELRTPVRPEDPKVETLVDLISWDTYRHYPVHARAIIDHETWPKPNV